MPPFPFLPAVPLTLDMWGRGEGRCVWVGCGVRRRGGWAGVMVKFHTPRSSNTQPNNTSGKYGVEGRGFYSPRGHPTLWLFGTADRGQRKAATNGNIPAYAKPTHWAQIQRTPGPLPLTPPRPPCPDPLPSFHLTPSASRGMCEGAGWWAAGRSLYFNRLLDVRY